MTETLAQSVAASLRQAIASGVYRMGERLAELAIAQEMGVSQNTARDALHLLEAEGWVVRHARRVATVRSFTRGEAQELYALWGALAALALGWAVADTPRGRLLRQLRLPLDSALALLGQHGAVSDPLPLLDALYEFHHTIAAAGRAVGKAQTALLLTRVLNSARVLETDALLFAPAPRPVNFWAVRVANYERLLGIIKFGSVEAVQDAMRARIAEDGALLLETP